jgi:tetratricopeptide (TPR) repeat protein
MNVCLVSVVFVLLISSYASCQRSSQISEETGNPVRITADPSVFKQELAHRIAVARAAVQQAESSHASNPDLSRDYVQLGLLYQDAAQWNLSEAALEHAVSLLRRGSEQSEDLADAICHLGRLHVLTGRLGESEREQEEALKLRQGLGDRLQIARSWSDLAAVYLGKQKFAKARDFSQQALTEFVTNGRADWLDRVSTRFALAETLCAIKECPSAIPVLKAALDETKAKVEPNDFPVGLANFLLGYAYWKSGDMSGAAEYLERGTVLMNAQLGWGHPSYLKALKSYAQFLREDQRLEAASVVERRIRQAEAVVDVHSVQTAQGFFAGLR